MKKLLFTFIPLLLLGALSLASCDKGGNTPADTTTGSQNAADTTSPITPEDEDLMIIDHGKTKFAVVYKNVPGTEIFTAVKSFANEIKASYGIEIEYGPDKLEEGESHDPAAFEILVGDTNYSESAAALEKLRICDYSITRAGNKIVVAAKDEALIGRALTYLRKNIIAKSLVKEDDGSVSAVFSEFTYLGEIPIDSIKLAGTELDNFTIVYAASAKGYSGYAETLRSLIFDQYGKTLTVVSDSKSEPTAHEILVGPTNRAETTAFSGAHPLSPLSFAMGMQNGKFVITGMPYSCLQAITRFAARYLYDGSRNVTISADEYFSDTFLTVTEAPLAEGADIRIMTANILAHFQSWNTTNITTPVYERCEILSALLDVYRPDAIGIQEVTDDWDVYIPEYCGKNYAFVHMKTPDGLVNYSTILYDKTRYNVIDSGVQYFTTEGKNNIRLVTWAVFGAKSSDTKFVLFNTHWCWDTEAHAHQQALEESQLMEKVLAKYPYPYFCTADYNTKQETANYNYFLELTGAVDAKYVARDNGTLLNVAGGCGNLGSKRANSGNSIDHIFMSPSCDVREFATIIWNGTWDLSDHSPKYADIKLKK